MADTAQFSVWVTKLSGRISSLESSIGYRSAQEIERECNTCKAELQHLYEYAYQHRIDLIKEGYYSTFTDLQTRLQRIENQIQQKQYRAQASDVPFWRRAANFIIGSINFVASLLGIGSVLPRLPGPDYPRLPGS